ncbi:10759_t:CDS:2 [Paraglomus brasilianum]|uniref:GTP:AMP phosphotransferase, mitochondrial n=1 Tax=Paraglomus brasilianum TaxID=144538 RepID=A0A9N9BFB4_9GLOM|nr:10759_t:CDS:2 [Paraglomus brasilianum]
MITSLTTRRISGNVLTGISKSKRLGLISRWFSGTAHLERASPAYDSQPIRLLLLGSPGAGKGTQSARIQKNFNLAAISSGNLLRQNIARGTEVGKMAAAQMERGAFVSDDIMIELINDELVTLEQQNWLLDGFPRTINQAASLDKTLTSTGQPLNLVINLHVPEEVILQRIMDRWVHVPSGRVYNLSYNPPKRHGYDDITGERLTKRPDDNPEIFKVRLQKHMSLTEPLLEYYAKRNILVTCAGRTSDEIYPQIEAELICRFGLGNARRVGEVVEEDEKRAISEQII